jgi:serine/threonine-protein kinase
VLRLTTFGGLALTGSGRPLPAAALQPRRLALLAVLAVAGDRGATRDRLLALLWPEVDAGRGRAALSQALYGLRRATGVEALVLGGETLRLSPAALANDVAAFEAALARGDRAAAAAVYAGPFLHGASVPGVPTFDDWVAGSARASGAGRPWCSKPSPRRRTPAATTPRRCAGGDASRRWTRWARAPRRAVAQGLAAAGDRAGALAHLDAHAARVRAELDAEPSAALLDLARGLRATAAPRRVAERFAIEREIGRGGMAVVYLARDLRHGRPLALKMLAPELGAALTRERFDREIQITARLQHPHILPLYDSGAAEDGTLFYVCRTCREVRCGRGWPPVIPSPWRTPCGGPVRRRSPSTTRTATA